MSFGSRRRNSLWGKSQVRAWDGKRRAFRQRAGNSDRINPRTSSRRAWRVFGSGAGQYPLG